MAPRVGMVAISPIYIGIVNEPIPQEIPQRIRPMINMKGEIAHEIRMPPMIKPRLFRMMVFFRPSLVCIVPPDKPPMSPPTQNEATANPLYNK